MATTSKRNRTGKANLWEFLLALSGNRAIVGLLGFLTVSIVVSFLLVVGLQGRPISMAGWTIGGQPLDPTTAPSSTAPAVDAPLAAVVPTSEAPRSTSTGASTVAAPAATVEAPVPTIAARPDCPRPAQALSKNAELIGCAWGFWGDAEYAKVVAVTDECIDMFGGLALRDQQTLSRDGKPAPITGQPVDRAELNEILKRGVLNDVAACYFVKGQALEGLGRLIEAREAYTNAVRLPYARVWDPAGDPAGLGFFWSPAQAASDRLAVLP